MYKDIAFKICTKIFIKTWKKRQVPKKKILLDFIFSPIWQSPIWAVLNQFVLVVRVHDYQELTNQLLWG